ncbi:NAD-dependent epimerase/dehydratase family protein [Corynebacterium sp. A21]|uniref:NAD-dependent epimerase/dehydratase family protein n=1 Tax=Corynebacterium sp. A21 TaxID=3457318 RepID=UPI003FCF3494
MRVAVVGATGNVGTAVLTALHDTPEITGILGIARRMPDQNTAPYAGCEWTSIDIGAGSSPEPTVEKLRGAFAGADAVIHLAWLVQPNSQRELLRQVNVEGTRRVAQAAAAAGVSHLVVASSVGAYSPDQSGQPRDESWPTGGIPSSHYSVDKSAQEKVLDEFSQEHPEVMVTRLRPGLTFQAAAASEIHRYFLGKLIPVQVLKAGRLPLLPLPKGVNVQAAHATDIGRAYATAVVKKVPGAFNICADDILGPQELADLLDHGHFLELPPPLVRAAVAAAYKSGTIAADPGWLDMALQAPLMDNSRAKSELGWQPRFTAAQALAELLAGLAEGSGGASAPLRPRKPTPSEPKISGGTLPPHRAGELPESLSRYLTDHRRALATGEVRIHRISEAFLGTPVYVQLSEISEALSSEHQLLNQLVDDPGSPLPSYQRAASWIEEQRHRFTRPEPLTGDSPMMRLREIEVMSGAITEKIGGWQTLGEHAVTLGVDPSTFAELAANAEEQLVMLAEVHAYARNQAFRSDRDTSAPTTATDKPEESAKEK